MKKYLLLLPFCLTVGCISRRAGNCDGKTVQQTFVPGKTTQAEVTRVWGNPAKIKDGEWIYQEKQTLGAQARLAYFGIGVTIGDLGTQVHSCTLTFDDRGVLRSVETGDTAPQVYHWRIWPFN